MSNIFHRILTKLATIHTAWTILFSLLAAFLLLALFFLIILSLAALSVFEDNRFLIGGILFFLLIPIYVVFFYYVIHFVSQKRHVKDLISKNEAEKAVKEVFQTKLLPSPSNWSITRKAIFAGSIILLVLSVALFLRFHLYSQISSKNRQIAETKKEMEKYRQIDREVTAIKKNLSLLHKKITIIRTLEQNRSEAIRLYDTMTRVVVRNRMWFTELRYLNNKSVEIKGIAADSETIAVFIKNLEQSRLFLNARLKNVNETKIQDFEMKSFWVQCDPFPIKKPVTSKKIKRRKKRK